MFAPSPLVITAGVDVEPELDMGVHSFQTQSNPQIAGAISNS